MALNTKCMLMTLKFISPVLNSPWVPELLVLQRTRLFCLDTWWKSQISRTEPLISTPHRRRNKVKQPIPPFSLSISVNGTAIFTDAWPKSSDSALLLSLLTLHPHAMALWAYCHHFYHHYLVPVASFIIYLIQQPPRLPVFSFASLKAFLSIVASMIFSNTKHMSSYSKFSSCFQKYLA